MHESTIRRRLSKMGYRAEKSRQRMLHSDNKGGFMLLEGNHVLDGDRYSMSLNDLENVARLSKDETRARYYTAR